LKKEKPLLYKAFKTHRDRVVPPAGQKILQTALWPKQPGCSKKFSVLPHDSYDATFLLDMSFWRKIVNDYREGFHGVISQPKSPKIANFCNTSGNGSK